ncbi:MAG TPA: glycosyltransferase [Rhizomicrobium sp.]|nr:glycosyltransferase [Rhizomicrobium sp.]
MLLPPLSILHVNLSRGFGGAEQYCLDLAARQLRRGHKAGLVMLRAARGTIGSRAPAGLALHEAAWIFPSRAVARAIAVQKPDILHAHLPDAARAVTALRRRPPAVLTLHIRYRQREMRGIAGLICIANWQEQEAACFTGPRITAHNWPPDEPPFDPARIAAARTEIGADQDTFVVGAIARLNRIKRLDLLIDAWKHARPAKARLALIGSGPESRTLMARAAGDDTIRFLGHRADPQNWHRALDLYVLPSDWEGLPLSVLEAMRAGTPILATASAGTAEVLQGADATLVPCGDRAALADALARLGARFAQGALPRRAYDMSRFDPERAVARIDDFYRQLIARSPT